MNRRITPPEITYLDNNQIFVFGSNLVGYHLKGAAKTALDKFGAKFGKPIGLQGNSYAIPTKDRDVKTVLPIDKIAYYVNVFIKYARENQNLTFFVTEIGCGLARYEPKNIAPLFKGALYLENVYLPYRFMKILINEESN